jgi:hypothetical protein
MVYFLVFKILDKYNRVTLQIREGHRFPMQGQQGQQIEGRNTEAPVS